MADPAYPAPHRLYLRVLLAASLLLLAGTARAAKWATLSQEDLQRKAPEIDPNAAAEILLKETVYDHSTFDASQNSYHLVVKIYSERGLEEFSKVEIPYQKGSKVRDIEARVVKPDGTSLELQPKDIYNRDVLKADSARTKVKSFAPPGLEVGSILEYRYTEICDEFSGLLVVLFQSEQPARLVRVKVKLLDFTPPGFYVRSLTSNCPNMPLVKGKDNFYTFERTNVPAAKEEPMQPPRFDTDMSLLLYYTRESEISQTNFWKNHSKTLFKDTESKAKVTRIVKAKLAEIVESSEAPDIKLQKIYDFCRTKITHRYRDTTDVSEAQRGKWTPNETASDVLKSGSGGTEDINLAFVALARAAGFDARIAACNDRDFISFARHVPDSFMLPDFVAAVWINSEWKYCAPGTGYLPIGMLPWWNTETAILVGDKDGREEPKLVRGATHTESSRSRTATLTLDPDGVLEGDVSETFTGQYEAREKNELDAQTPKEQEEYVRDTLQRHQKLAEVSNVKVENAANPLSPLKITYHLRIPEYGDRTGSRIFLQPAVFQKGVPPLFQAAERRTNIVFHFRSTSLDDIRIKLPDGYGLEQASAPGPLDFGALGAYQLKIGMKKKTNELFITRKLELKGVLFFSQTYPAIRQAFMDLCNHDAHTLTLKRIENTPVSASASAEQSLTKSDSPRSAQTEPSQTGSAP